MNTEHADPGERLSLGQRLAGALAIGLLAGAFFGAFGVAWAARPQLPPQHVTADAQSGPFSLASVSDAVAGHYQHAAANHDVYRQVTCYCGCESFADHAGLSDCFVDPVTSDWDLHAAGCGVCLDEAAEVRRLLARGHEPGEIAEVIDAQFGPAASPAATT